MHPSHRTRDIQHIQLKEGRKIQDSKIEKKKLTTPG